MGIQVIITGDNFASIKGDMQDFVDGGYLDVSGADFEGQEPQISTTEIPFPAAPKQKRGRKPKAPAPTVASGQVAAAPSLPAPPAPTLTSAAAAPQTVAPATDAGTSTAPAAAALSPDAVAPGGAVFNAVKAYNDKHGMEKARALLLEFGCGMVRQIKPEQYAAVIAKCAE